MKKVAISVGDLNGVGLEIALRSHEQICEICEPYYAISQKMLSQGAKLLRLEVDENINLIPCEDKFNITAGVPTKKSGKASYNSFVTATKFVKNGGADALVTLPISKKAWSEADIPFVGHTDALAHIFKKDAIMMLGCEKLFVALFTHHIRIKNISKHIRKKPLSNFLIDFYNAVKVEKIGVLALNPHAGDGGVIGDEEISIKKAIVKANEIIGSNVFEGVLVPDVAFTKANRQKYNHFVCMYHDQGLIPLKTLYFDESINVSLNLPIVRTSVDHGTAYDKAYKNYSLNLNSYINAIKYAIK